MVSEWDAKQLGVHPAISTESAVGPALPELTAYVRRPHDSSLDHAVSRAAGGTSVVAFLIGRSSTGKTRAMWEAVQALPPEWALWHPLSPSPPEAVLAGLGHIGPRTVIWLDEAQLYLDPPGDIGERVAAALRSLLADSGRKPVIVLGALWPAYWDDITREGAAHPHARALLDGTDIAVPSDFSGVSFVAVQQATASDPRLAEAVAASADGQVTQYLAGVPELLSRYHNAPPAARAFIHAAMDACRLGCGPVQPQELLEAAAPAYLTDAEWDAAGDGWAEQGMSWTAVPCKGVPGPLTQVRPRPSPPGLAEARSSPSGGKRAIIRVPAKARPLYRLTDYLDQHGRRIRADHAPPPGFWDSVAEWADPGDQATLGDAAYERGLYRIAAQLRKNAAPWAGSAAVALIEVMSLVDPVDAHPSFWAVECAPLEGPHDVAVLLRKLLTMGAHEQIALLSKRDPAARVALDDADGLVELLQVLREAGDSGQAAVLAHRAAAHAPLHNPVTVSYLLGEMQDMGARDEVTLLLKRDPAAYVSLDDADRLAQLSHKLRAVGDHDQAAALLSRAAADIPLDHPAQVATLLRQLPYLGAPQEAAILVGRNPAAHAPLADTLGVAILLRDLCTGGFSEQIAVLLERHPAANSALANPVGVAILLNELRTLGASEQVEALLRRDLATQVALDNLGGVRLLLSALQDASATGQFTALASRAASDASLHNPLAVTELLDLLQRAGATEEFTSLASRAATDLSLDQPAVISWVLRKLQTARTADQASALASRAAATASLAHPAAAASLLRDLQDMGETHLVDVLRTRLITAGMFSATADFTSRFPFGSEPDGRPATSWGWDDLH